MTLLRVQCKGSGRSTTVSFNLKRADCPVCGNQQDITGTGKIRKHMRTMTKRQLRGSK